MKRLIRRALTLHEIINWASAHREVTGKWPTRDTGGIPGTIGETWARVDAALRDGRRGLPGGSSLAQLLAEQCGARNIQALPPLTEDQILAWTDDHHQFTGSWPTADSGFIPNTDGEKWSSVDTALRDSLRGLAGGSSLAKLLDERRGVRNRKQLPPFTEEQILAWADAHHQRTGSWPTGKSGPILEAPGETWTAVWMALDKGRRGLPGGSSLALLLAQKRGVRNVRSLPNLTVEQILAWADAFHDRTGRWPNLESGPILEAPAETWSAVNHALNRGSRGLPGGTSLAKVLAIERGVRNQASMPRLSRKSILDWASAHHQRTGKWPVKDSGPIPECPGETWLTVNEALRNGRRGLRGKSTLAQLLDEHGAKPNHLNLPPLSRKKIVAWADAHHQRTGQWPNVNSGAVHEAPGERWDLIDNALREGHRGLTGGSSLLQLLVRKRGIRNPLSPPPLTEEQIGQWADLHFQRTGKWPKSRSGPIADAPGETWVKVDWALREGKRGLPGGSSLAKVVAARQESCLNQ
jgi:hypothetical protein